MPENGYENEREILERMSSPELDQFTDREIIDIFIDDKAYFVTADHEDLKKADARCYIHLFPCKIARPSQDTNTLRLLHGFWCDDFSSHRSLYIRDAYRDHWEITKHNV